MGEGFYLVETYRRAIKIMEKGVQREGVHHWQQVLK